MLKAKGIISVDIRKMRVVIDMHIDFIKYYQWFLLREYWAHIDTPLHGAHITISNNIHHTGVNWAWAYKQYHGKEIEFEYDEDIIVGGRRKGFTMFYMKVFSKDFAKIKKDIGTIESIDYRGEHVTLGLLGKSGMAIRPWWPDVITVK